MGRKKRSDYRKSCLSPAQIEWAYQKWCEGYTLEKIAETLYVSQSTVYKSFKGRKRYLPPLEPPRGD